MTKYECLSIFSLQVEAIVFLCLSKHFFKRSGKNGVQTAYFQNRFLCGLVTLTVLCATTRNALPS